MMTATTGRAPHLSSARPLYTDTDVLRRVDALIDTEARSSRTLWLMFVDAFGSQLPVMTVIDDVPERIDRRAVDGLCSIVAHVMSGESPGGSVIVVLTDPQPDGPDGTEASTAEFARLVRAAQLAGGVPIRMLCLATHSAVRQLL